MSAETLDLLVFSHLRWDFVFQRPQHLFSRHAKTRRVFYFEEPVYGMTDIPRLHLRETLEKVMVVVPYLPTSTSDETETLRELLDELCYEEDIVKMTLWYYSPLALSYSDHIKAEAVIYDCIDEFSLVADLEGQLLKKADLVFTGGRSLFEAKQGLHNNIHSFPSSIDFAHFIQARLNLVDPEDQASIPKPRIGFYGVIDERIDLELLRKVAELRPDYQFVMIGPISNVDAEAVPRSPNIHYLGKKDYHSLPHYLSGWDCTFIPFAHNESTRFICPTKTPEFLAAGRPVVSTSIRDVVEPYGNERLVYIADDAVSFVLYLDRAVEERSHQERLKRVDSYLSHTSWDTTFEQMSRLENAVSLSDGGSVHA